MTYGYWDTEGGWVQRLRKDLDKRSLENEDEEHEVMNLGISGEDSEQLCNRLQEEVERRTWETLEQVLLIQIGANDIQYLRGEERIRVPENEYRENLEELITQAREVTDTIMLVGEPPTTINGPIPWAEEKELSDGRMEKYTKIQKKMCKNEEISFIDVRNLYSKKEWSNLLEDGCHPNNQGHREIYRAVKQKLANEEIL